MKRVIVLFGAPGAGKGTQASRLASELSLPHVSTGDLFRENLSRGTALGKQARQYMDGGRLVPDELVTEMLFDRVERRDCESGYLLDGFPRTLPQAESLERRLEDDADVVVIDLEVPEEVILARAAGRLVCEGCGHTHHTESSPPETPGECDACGGKLVRRDDDRSEVVQERLRVYRDQTEPVVEYYRGRGIVCPVDGDRRPEEVFASCLACLTEAR